MNNSRHEGIFSPTEHKHKTIHIIGLGNIGSHTAIALTRMGFESFALYDFDDVEDVNIATQCFNDDHEGMTKIEAMRNQMQAINPDIKVSLFEEELDKESPYFMENHNELNEPLCIISGVDSMEVRGIIKTLLEESMVHTNTPVIDGRLGKEQVEVLFSETPANWDLEVEQDILADVGCTEKYISYTPLMVAALISSTVKKLCSNERIPSEVIFEFASNNYLKKYENN